MGQGFRTAVISVIFNSFHSNVCICLQNNCCWFSVIQKKKKGMEQEDKEGTTLLNLICPPQYHVHLIYVLFSYQKLLSATICFFPGWEES